MGNHPEPRRKVAIVYHFFPRYRGPMMTALFDSDRYEYLAVGGRHDPTSGQRAAWEELPEDRFIHAPCRQFRSGIMLQRGLIRLALRRDLDAIIYHGNALWPNTWISTLIARATGKRVLFWTHGWWKPEPGLKGFIRRRFYKLAHGLQVYGHLAKVIGIQQGFAPESIYVVYNSLDHEAQLKIRDGITPERVAAVRGELFPGSDRPLVISTSRLKPQRRFDLLLDAMELLKAEGHPVDVLLVGDGVERAKLEQDARERDLSVKFYGECYEETRLAELIAASNVSVSPGAIGLTAMHSLVYGVPVITHDNTFHHGPEWETILPGKTGGFFKQNDAEDLARLIKIWTPTRLPDESLRSVCHEIVDRFWTPRMQRAVIERSLDGLPADDLFWMKPDGSRHDLSAARSSA